MVRVFHLLMAGAVVAGLTCGEALAQQSEEKQTESITRRLDEILKRLDSIETRLELLESRSYVYRWRADERGILRDAQGRPLGFWGIDTPMQTPTRR